MARDPATELSRFLSLVLRHRPQLLGLELDQEGWVDLEELVDAMARVRGGVTREAILEIVRNDPRRRFEVDPPRRPRRIRATYGHSVPVEIPWPEVAPPEILWHGTARRFVPSILREGLLPMKRRMVHLSPTREMAKEVGARRDPSPAVLAVLTGAMHRAGYAFRETPGGIFLVSQVPPAFIREEDAVKRIVVFSAGATPEHAGLRVQAELNDSPSARAFLERLPLEVKLTRWGDEYYGDVGLDVPEAPDARTEMEVGELAIWPEGRALCIFLGPTPASRSGEPRAISPVNPIGRLLEGVEELKALGEEITLRVERSER
jgi:putative RNA 2'-phosphotransferase